MTTQPKKTGFQKSQDEKKTYYYDGSGNMVHGQQNINGKWYLFDEQTGEMKTGFQYISSQKKKVYYSNAGQMQYGQQHIDRYYRGDADRIPIHSKSAQSRLLQQCWPNAVWSPKDQRQNI